MAATTLLCACGDKSKNDNGPPLYMLYSPNGEPLNGGALGRPDCKTALTAWFNRMAGASGIITQPQFMADAQAQFQRMDIDHQGYIVSEELDRFRAPYRQQSPLSTDSDNEKHGRGSHAKGGGEHGDKPSANSVTANIFDPVMSADANLDFRVTPEEFTNQARDVFAKLDADHSASLSLPEVLASCPAAKDGK